MIAPSPGVFVAPFDGGGVAYDVLEETAHILGPLGFVVASIGGPTTVGEIISELVVLNADLDAVELAASIADVVTRLRGLRLIDRTDAYEPPAAWHGSRRQPAEVEGWITGVPHQVVGWAITFRTNDPSLLKRIDACFQPVPPVVVSHAGDDGIRGAAFIDVERLADGGVRVDAHDRWDFADIGGFFRQIPDFVNEFAARNGSYATLHAGAVRTPDGRVLVLPGQVDSGKSTLTAALVAAGCDYISDESVGLVPGHCSVSSYIKPISLSRESRTALGLRPQPMLDLTSAVELREDVALLQGTVGPPSEILLSRYEPGASPCFERIAPRDALRELLANTHNLARAGAAGLSAVAAAAETIPVSRATHSDANGMAPLVVGRQT